MVMLSCYIREKGRLCCNRVSTGRVLLYMARALLEVKSMAVDIACYQQMYISSHHKMHAVASSSDLNCYEPSWELHCKSHRFRKQIDIKSTCQDVLEHDPEKFGR